MAGRTRWIPRHRRPLASSWKEAGIGRITSLVALHDGTGSAHRTDATGSPWHVYKLMFLAERPGPPLRSRSLVWMARPLDVGFFDHRRLAAAVHGRTTPEQLRLMLSAHRDPSRPAVFD